MLKYEWIVIGLSTQTINNEENYVVVADFNVVGTEEEYTSKVMGTQTFSISGEVFVPYEDLTNDLVVTWIKNLVNVEEIIAFIDADLYNQQNPPIPLNNPPLPKNFYLTFLI